MEMVIWQRCERVLAKRVITIVMNVYAKNEMRTYLCKPQA